MLVFFVSMFAILGLYQYFVMGPQAKRQQAELQAHAAAVAAAQHQAAVSGAAPTPLGVAPGAEAGRSDPHVGVDTPSLSGQIDLRGATIDQLYLKHYHLTTDPKSPLVQLLSPAWAPHAWFARVGWAAGNSQELPDDDAIVWTAAPGAVLTPATPAGADL